MGTMGITINPNLLSDKLEIIILETDCAKDNIDLDTVIALDVASGKRPPTVRLWRHSNEPGIVVSKKDVAGPLGQRAIEQVHEIGYEVYVRHTGGTAVPHARGVLNLSMMFPRSVNSGTTDDYYRILCQPQIDWLATYGIVAGTGEVPGSYCDGKYNVIVDGKKLVGTAQSWRGGLAGIASRHPGYVLAHACIMVDVNLNWGVQLINQFYEWVANPYRAEVTTSTTLKQLSTSARVGAPLSSGDAMQEFAMFLLNYFQGFGVSCLLKLEG